MSTNLQKGKFVLQHEAFVKGEFDTHFISKYFKPDMLNKSDSSEAEIAALFAALSLMDTSKKQERVSVGPESMSKWKSNRLS
jgi:acetyl-CoA carboxylase biotin carboxylase subunit